MSSLRMCGSHTVLTHLALGAHLALAGTDLAWSPVMAHSRAALVPGADGCAEAGLGEDIPSRVCVPGALCVVCPAGGPPGKSDIPPHTHIPGGHIGPYQAKPRASQRPGDPARLG